MSASALASLAFINISLLTNALTLFCNVVMVESVTVFLLDKSLISLSMFVILEV